MSKFPLAWHEENLKNSSDYEARLRKQLQNQQEEIDRLAKDNEFERMQIAEAKRRGMDAFDAQRFLKKLRSDSTRAGC